jgi:DbpA RNA binding domain
LTTEERVTHVSDAQAALERGRAILIVTPPAVEQAGALWELLAAGEGSGVRTVVVCGDVATACEWADAAPPALRLHAVTALGRTTRLLRAGAIDALAGTPEDLQALVTRSALKLDTVTTAILAWPEWLQSTNRVALLEPLFSEMRDNHRIVLAWNPPALDDLLERYARRPHVLGDLPMGDDARPLPAVAPARYAIVPRARRDAARREVLDALDRTTVAVWRRGTDLPDQADAVICVDLPSRDELAAVVRSGEAVLLLSPDQVPYARTIAAPLTPLPLDGGRTRGRSDAEALRGRLAERIAAGGLEAELGLLEPLLERYDAAEVAAALLAVSRQPAAVSDPQAPKTAPAAPTPPDTWVKLFINVGKKDRAGAKDLVGALIREVGLSREDIGRIETRDAFSLVSVAPHVADAAIRGLSRVAIRGRRIAARRDREA